MNDANSASDRPQPSAQKIAANQANAQHSTGPRSPGGKAKSSQNSIKYGFYSQAVLMNGEDPQAYDDPSRRRGSQRLHRSHRQRKGFYRPQLHQPHALRELSNRHTPSSQNRELNPHA